MPFVILAQVEGEQEVVLAEEGAVGTEQATETEAPSGIEVILPEIPELIFGSAAFLLVFFALWKFAFPPMMEALKARTDKIQGDLDEAETAKTEARTELADYKTQLAGARDEANRIIEESRKTADQLRKDIQAKAETEAQATVIKAQEEIRAERDRALQELKAQVGDIAVDLAGRVVGKSLDKGAHEKLIDDYITSVAGSGEAK